jgi:acyl carrier protein
VAYCTTAAELPSGAALKGALEGYLRERLPPIMVPAEFVVLPEFPLTPNQKVDRGALPSPRFESELRKDSKHVPFAPQLRTGPRNRGAEERVAEIWKELLGLDRVGLDDNFFDLGGHSLLTVRVHGRIRETFDMDLRITDLFRHPTVRSLAAFLAAPNGEEPAAQATVAGARDRGASRRAAFRSRTSPKGSWG